jgi:hypothetical protein
MQNVVNRRAGFLSSFGLTAMEESQWRKLWGIEGQVKSKKG